MGRKITLSNISQETGLSVSTISRVLTNHGYASPETRSLIENAVKKLGYQKKEPAKKKLSDMSDMVLIEVAQMGGINLDMIRGATEYLNSRGRKALVHNCEFNDQYEAEYLSYADRNSFFGIIVFTTLETPLLIHTMEYLSCPLVLMHPPFRSLNVDAVCMDNMRGAYMMTRYMIEKGHRHIGLLAGTKNTVTTRDRESGYRSALKDAGLEVHPEYIHYGTFREDSGHDYVTETIKRYPKITGVFCCNDIMAVSLVNVLFNNGYKVPDDISVTSYHKTFASSIAKVTLTAIDFNYRDMGRNAAKLLVERYEHPDAPQKIITLSPSLYIGDSVKNLNPDRNQ